MHENTFNRVLTLVLACLVTASMFGALPSSTYAASFGLGDTVEVTTNLNVRTGPGTSYSEITDPDYPGYAPTGTRGEIINGPSAADGYTWWEVDYGPGLYSGWSVEGGLVEVVPVISASIISYSPTSTIEVAPGNSVTISVTFSNTGDTPWKFIAGATVWNSAGSEVANYSHPLSTALQPGQQTTASWSHTVSQTGDYWLQFGVWKATPYISENLLARSPSPSQLLIRGIQQNQPPTCSVSANPSSGDAPLTVSFTMNANDPDGTIAAWVLDVNGDGNADYSGTGNPPSTKSHTYTLPGTYTVILMVSDDDSVSTNSIATVHVGSPQIPPTCSLSVNPQFGTAPLTVTFSITANDPDGSIETWVLDVGEDGVSDYTGTGNPPSTISHTYTTAGIHTAVLMVSDDDDLTAAATSTVSVSASGQPALSCSPASFSFSAAKNGANPSSQSLNIWNSDEGTLSWTVSDGANWLNLSPTAGSSTGEMDTVTVSASISGKDAGIYNAVITVSASGAANAPQNIPVTLTITGSDTVTFPDAHLEAAIRGTLGKSTGDITQTDLAGITILSAPYHSISNLSGLEYCTSLSELNLLNNSITDISPLAGCTQLYLLTLTGNQVTDISALASLPALKLVYLGRNQISDVSPLSGLQYLQRVVLFSNQVSDISPLAQNTGIGSGEELDLRTNPLSEVSIDTYIPQLQSRGVNVLYDSSISITCDTASLTFTAVKGGNNPAGQTISVWRSGAGSALNWTISEDAAWLTASPTSGSSTGEQDTVTASVNIAGMDSGVYQTDITISAAGAANSPQTVPVTLNISDAAKPDLIIETIMWSPQNPSVGDTVTFTVTVKNQGSTQAGSSYVYYFIDGVQYTYDSVYSINSGASRTETFTWKIQQGVHTIVAVADYRGQITENNESNNEKTISFSPALSDLIVQSITWLPEHPSVGDSVTFTVTIKNQGNGDAASSKVYYFVDDSQQGYDSVYSLDAGSTTTETFSWTMMEDSHVFKAFIDYDGEVPESDEENNENTITIGSPDVSVEINSYVPVTPLEVKIGESVILGVTFTNIGNADWTFYGAASLRRPDGTEEHLQLKSVSLTPGEQGNVTWNYIIDVEGSWDIVFGIWKEQEQVNSLEYTGWLKEYIICIEDDTIAPQVNSLLVDPSYIVLDDSFTISYSVSDKGGSGLSHVELWRANDNYSSPGNWAEITRTLALGSSDSGSFTDTPSSAGSYWYGIHVVDNEDNWATEDSAVKVEVKPVSVVEVPIIEYIDPSYGASGETIRIVGNNFKKEKTSLLGEYIKPNVIFGETSVGDLVLWTDQEIVFKVPEYLRGNKQVDVRVEFYLDFGFSSKKSNTVQFTYKEPLLESVFPLTGSPGDHITLQGDYFGTEDQFGNSVRFGSTPLVLEIVSWSDNEIVVEAPNDYGMGLGLAKDAFTLLALAKSATNKVLFWFAVDLLDIALPRINIYEFVLDMNDPLPKQFAIIAAAIAAELVPFGEVTVKPTGDFEVDVKVKNRVGESAPQPFTFTEVGSTIHIEDSLIAHLASPGELRVYDSQGNVSGMVKGVTVEEIPGSMAVSSGVFIKAPKDTYHYEVVGTDKGTYGLEVVSIENENVTNFSITDVSTSEQAVHQYTINWDALHKGEPSIGVQIDADGDKIFEQVKIVQPPIASFIFSPISTLTNESIEFDASESHDVDGEIISYKWNFGDGKASTGKIVTHTYTDPGEYTIVLAVIDDNGLLTTNSKAIQVEQGKEGGFPTWAWICIGLVIGVVIAFGVWRYHTAKGFLTGSQK